MLERIGVGAVQENREWIAAWAHSAGARSQSGDAERARRESVLARRLESQAVEERWQYHGRCAHELDVLRAERAR